MIDALRSVIGSPPVGMEFIEYIIVAVLMGFGIYLLFRIVMTIFDRY